MPLTVLNFQRYSTLDFKSFCGIMRAKGAKSVKLNIKNLLNGESKRAKEREDAKKRKLERENLQLAGWVNLTTNQFLNLVGDESIFVLLKVARNLGIPHSGIWVLVRNPHPRVRAAVAENPNILENALKVLAQDPDENVSIQAKIILSKRLGQEGININPSSFFCL